MTAELMSLHEAIANLVGTGEIDPLEIARKIAKRYDKEWRTAQLLALEEDIVTELARQELGRVRRSLEVALQPGNPMASAEMKLAKVWVPGYGYKIAADVTLEDAALKVREYQTMAMGLMRRAVWWANVAGLMKGERVGTLGELRAELPALPDDSDLDMPMIEAA